MARVSIRHHHISEDLNSPICKQCFPLLAAGQKIDFLLPSVNHIQDLKKMMLSQRSHLRPGQVFFGTYFAWAHRIFDMGNHHYRILRSGEEWLLLFRLLGKPSELLNNMKPGSLVLMRKIITDLQESGVAIEELMTSGEKCPDLSVHLEGLRYLLEFASEYHLAGSATLLMLLADYLERTPFTPPAKILLVAGFYEFNPIQRKLLNLLIDCYEQVFIYYPENESHPANEYIKPIREILPSREYGQHHLESVQKSDLQRLANQLFSPHQKRNETKNDEPGAFNTHWQNVSLKVLRCPGRRQELDAAARTIKSWIQTGIRAEDIALVYREKRGYPQLIRLILPDAGIPLGQNRRMLSDTVPVRLLQKIIEVNEQNFSRDTLVDLTRFQAIRDFYGGKVIQKFEYRSAAWGLSFNKESWLRQLNERQEYLQSVLDVKDERKDPFILQREQREIAEVLPFLKQFLDDISLPSSGSWSEYCMKLYGLLEKYTGVDDSDLEIRNAVLEILNQLQRLTDKETEVGLRYFGMAMNQLIGGVELPESDRGNDAGIAIDELMNVRHRRFKAVVLLGLVDGEFPVNRRDNPLMNAYQRNRINRNAGSELLRSSAANIDEEKFLLYHLFSRIEQHCLITYPQFDGNGRDLAESPFLDEIRNIANHPEISLEIQFEQVSASSVIADLDNPVSGDDILMNLKHYRWRTEDAEVLKALAGKAISDLVDQRIDIEKQRRERIANQWSGNLSISKHRDFCFRRPLSVTRLQQYAWCPFLFLCGSIWKIDSVEEPSAEITALSDGLLIHALLEHFLKKAAPQNFNKWQDFLNRDLTADVDSALKYIRNKYRTVFGHIDDLLWTKKNQDLRKGLELFIQRERAALEAEFFPLEFEQRYSYSIPLNVDEQDFSVPFQVKIDRIDKRAENQRILVEYKRSSHSVQDPREGVAEGIHFQIPVYLLAYQEQCPAAEFLGAYSYVFNEGKMAKGIFTEQLFPRNKPIAVAEFKKLLTDTRRKIIEYLHEIYTGNFFLNPYDVTGRCQYGKCPYYEICRIDPRMVELSSSEND